MHIVHVTTKSQSGGAAIATSRINKALNKIGTTSEMVVQSEERCSSNITEVPKNKLQKGLARIRPFINSLPTKPYRKKREAPFSVARIGVDITDEDVVQNADIINLHWINGGFLSTRSIEKLESLKVPVVWTLHDMWSFTGGCHYSGGCEKYADKCGACPVLQSDKKRDLTRRIWKRKRKAYKGLDLHIVTPSTWLANLARKSSLFNDPQIKVIPNCLDTSIYKPIERKQAREILNLPKDKKIILFGAVSATSDPRKGFQYLRKAMKALQREENFTDEISLLVFGASQSSDISKLPFEAKFLGHLFDDYTLVLAYSAADIFVAPSLEEAFGQTLTEAMACGTPAVSFNYSGPVDIVDHKGNGYLAEYKSPEDLTEGIKWILESKIRLQKLGDNARQKVLNNYTYDEVGKQYLSYYKKII